MKGTKRKTLRTSILTGGLLLAVAAMGGGLCTDCKAQSAPPSGAGTRIQAIPVPPVPVPGTDASGPWKLFVHYVSPITGNATDTTVGPYLTKDRCDSAGKALIAKIDEFRYACIPGP